MLAAPRLVAERPLSGAGVTADALYSQRALCAQITAAGGDYPIVVKGNQPRLPQDLRGLFEAPPPETTFGLAEPPDRHGDRREARRVRTSGELSGDLGWPGARQVGKIERVVRQKGHVRSQVRSFVTSLPAPDPPWGIRGAGPAQLLRRLRGHWGSENRLHYVRDVACGEDACQARTGAAPQGLAALRNTVIGLLRDAGWTNLAAGLRYNAWRPGAALQLLGLSS